MCTHVGEPPVYCLAPVCASLFMCLSVFVCLHMRVHMREAAASPVCVSRMPVCPKWVARVCVHLVYTIMRLLYTQTD